MAPYINDQQANTGLFIPTTSVFELSQLQSADVNSTDFKQILVRLYQTVNSIALSLNAKDSGYFLNEEFVTGSLYFNPTSSNQLDLRPVFRKVINFGALPNAATKTVAHNLTPDTTWSFTRIYGCATDPVALSYIPLPYSASTAVADNLELYVDNTNVSVATGANYSAYTVSYVVLEYIKQ